MPLEVGRTARRAGSGQIGRTGDDDALAVAEATRDVAGVGQLADADGDVEGFFDEIDVAVGQVQIDGEFRVRCGERADARRDVGNAQAAREAGAQASAQGAAGGTGRRFGFGQFGQQRFAADQVRASCFGQADLAGRPLQQANAKDWVAVVRDAELCDLADSARTCRTIGRTGGLQ